MKRVLSFLLSILLVVFLFTACAKIPSEWTEALGENEYFDKLPAYTTGTITSAVFDTSCSIKVDDDDYSHFAKYVDTLKKNGFEFLPFSIEPENYSLNDQGQASWRATDGKIYLMIIFNKTGTKGYTAFGETNITIYGYTEKPAGWTLFKDMQ